MTTKKSKSVAETTEQTPLAIAEQRWANAEQLLRKLNREINDLQQMIDEKTWKIHMISEHADAAWHAHARAEEEAKQAAGRIHRARAMASVDEGMPSHDASLMHLEEMQRELEEAHRDLENAAKNAVVGDDDGDGLRKEIEEHKHKIAEKQSLIREIHAVQSDAFQEIGEAKAAILSDTLDSLGSALQEHREAMQSLEEEIEEELKNLKLFKSHYPKLYERLHFKHQIPGLDSSKSPEEKIAESHLAHLRCIAEHGPRVRRIHKELWRFCNGLDLNPHIMHALISDASTHQYHVGNAEQLLEDERRNRRRSSW